MKKRLHKKYILLSALLSSFVFGLVLFAIFVIDPAGVNNKFDLGLVKNSELSYRTQKFIEINKFKPSTIMLGGSRVHFLNTEDVKKYTKDKVYNISLSASTLEEQYYFLKYSLENFDITNVILGLNIYPFSDNPHSNDNTDFDKELFSSGFSFEKQIKYYLELPLTTYIKDYYIKQWNENLYNNGSRTAYNQLKYIDNRDWSEREKNSNKTYLDIYKNKFDFNKNIGFKLFNKMIQLCKKHNVNIKVFTTAIHTSQLQILKDFNKLDIYYKWKKEVAEITPYWDFMYPNSITINSDNYIDPSHIRQEKGYLYFARLFDDDSVDVPDDFGRHVDEDNIKEHLVYLKTKIQNYDLNQTLSK